MRWVRTPVCAYLISVSLSCVFYIAWVCLSAPWQTGDSFSDRLAIATFFCVFEGFFAAMVLMLPAWPVVVRISNKVGHAQWRSFAIAGAVLTFVLGCSMSSLAPKPLYIEDQSFGGGAMIAAERQGVRFGLAGLLFGLSYWAISGHGRLRTR